MFLYQSMRIVAYAGGNAKTSCPNIDPAAWG
jgi:hypothetical protein